MVSKKYINVPNQIESFFKQHFYPPGGKICRYKLLKKFQVNSTKIKDVASLAQKGILIWTFADNK